MALTATEQSTAVSDEGPSTSTAGSFKSPQSFGKAVKRTMIALPNFPRNKRAIIVKLVTIEGLRMKNEKKSVKQRLL